MLVYILFTYLFMIFLLALGISVESAAGLFTLAFAVVSLTWIFLEFSKRVRGDNPNSS